MSALLRVGFAEEEVADEDAVEVIDGEVILDVDEEAGRAGSFEGPAFERGTGNLPLTWPV